MSKKEEILHKLTTEDRNYIKEKFKEKDQQITDLEAKLPESNESHHKNIVELTKMATEKDRKIEELKQQLADKDKEIKKLTKSFAYKNNEDLTTTINGVKFTTEQIIALQQVGYSAEYDKNQIAITELEKARKYVDGRTYLAQYLDERVKQLKENRNV